MGTSKELPRRSGRRRLRVAQLIESLGLGGAEWLAVQIANARSAAGDLSYLYVMTAEGELSARVASDVHTRYLRYERASIVNPPAFASSVARGWRLLSRQIVQDGVEIVQSHLPGANYWGLLLQMRGICPVIPTIHNNQEFRYGREDQVWRAKLRRRAYVEMLRRCPAVVAVSEGVRASLGADLGLSPGELARVRVIANGVQIPESLDPVLARQVRMKYGIPGGDPLVLSAGRMTEQKNHVLLLEAMLRLRRTGVRCRAMIVGDGPLRAFLERRVDELGLADQVVLPGNVGDLTELMQGADLFVLPSLWEGLPLVLLEAMACGLPVVGTRIRGVAEVIEDGVNGLLVEPGDAGALAQAIATLLGNAELRAVFGAAGLAIVRREYNFERVVEALGRLYGETLPGA
jgi:glycosyltransferase involved in cell wall biosynthesis